MKNYQFRTNYFGQLVLQRKKAIAQSRFGDQEYAYVDAGAEDLKDYYNQVFILENTQSCNCKTQRELFESQCG